MPIYRTVFISHAHADNDRCARIAALLIAKGIDVWIDLTNLQTGYVLSDEISKQLAERIAFVLMVTPASNASRWVSQERGAYNSLVNTPATHYVHGVERVIVPVRLSDEVPIILRGIFWIDAQNVPDGIVADQIADALEVRGQTFPMPRRTRNRSPQKHSQSQSNVPLPSSPPQHITVVNFLWRQHTLMGWRILHFLVDVYGTIFFSFLALSILGSLAQAAPPADQIIYIVLIFATTLALFGLLALNIALTHFYASWDDNSVSGSLLRWFFLLPILLYIGIVALFFLMAS